MCVSDQNEIKIVILPPWSFQSFSIFVSLLKTTCEFQALSKSLCNKLLLYTEGVVLKGDLENNARAQFSAMSLVLASVTSKEMPLQLKIAWRPIGHFVLLPVRYQATCFHWWR